MIRDLSIVTVSTNQLPLIRQCLTPLYALPWTVTFEVALVDNACTDGTGDWVRRHFPQVKIVRNEVRKGYPENGNIGIQAQQNGRYVLTLNPDIVCLPGLLDELVAFMDAHPEVGIAGPKLLNPDMTLQPSCRRFSTPRAIFIRGLHLDGLFRRMRFIRDYLMEDLDHDEVGEVDWVTGALLIVRREAITQVGLMDDQSYFLYAEDQDWCCRMWQVGWRVCYIPAARAIHAHMREGIKKPWSRAARYQLKSAYRMFQKFSWELTRTPRPGTMDRFPGSLVKDAAIISGNFEKRGKP
jgi:hypothetical protein